jgi:hypothetical protein
MAKIIPSKNIYNRQNNKIIKNHINGVSATIGTVQSSNQEIGNFHLNIHQEETAKMFWFDYIQYKDANSIATLENVKTIGNRLIGNVLHIGFRFTLSSVGSFIDVDSITANVSFKVRYGVVYGSSANYSLHSDASYKLSDISDVENIKISFNDAYAKQTGVLSQQDFVNPLYIIWSNNTMSNNTTRSEKVIVDLYMPYRCTLSSAPTDANGNVQKQMYSGCAVTDVNISFYGNVLDLNATKDEKYGSEPFYDLKTNEMFFDTSVYQNTDLFSSLSKRIVTAYKNGKETAVIRCSVPEDLSVFEIGDEVIPMVYGADGVDRPMSRYKDGTQKVFNVVGTKFIYDGAVWQELTLQEKTQSV